MINATSRPCGSDTPALDQHPKAAALTPQATVSVVIVSWNARHHLSGCLSSIRAARPDCLLEVIVVDNASTDGSPEMVEQEFPEAMLIRAGSNLGFAKANNLAMRRARGSAFALVNSDALVHPGCLEALLEHLQRHPEVGLTGPRVHGGDGQLQLTCRNLPSLRNTICRTLALDRLSDGDGLLGGYEVSARRHDETRQVEVLSGCFCMVRRTVFETVGGMDERFFFYGEDIDWCKRIADAGWKIAFVRQALATHFGGGSSSGARLRFSVETLRADLQYWRKHGGAAGEWMCRILLVAHHGLRLAGRAVFDLRPGVAQDRSVKRKEHAACLKWLVFGLEPPTQPRTLSGGTA